MLIVTNIFVRAQGPKETPAKRMGFTEFVEKHAQPGETFQVAEARLRPRWEQYKKVVENQ